MPIYKKDVEYLEKAGSFQNKFGIKIAKAGIVAVPTTLLYMKKMKLTYSDFFFICLILAKKYDKKWPYFSLKKVHRELGINEATLHKAKDRLIAKDFLRITPRKENPKGKGRNTYDLSGLFCILKMYIDADVDKFFKRNNWKFEDPIGYTLITDMEKEKLQKT